MSGKEKLDPVSSDAWVSAILSEAVKDLAAANAAFFGEKKDIKWCLASKSFIVSFAREQGKILRINNILPDQLPCP